MTTTAPHRDSYWQIAAPVLFVILWSTGFIGGKLGLPYAEPFTFLLWRYGIVTLLLLALTLAMRAPWPTSPAQAAHIAVAGMLVNAIYYGFFQVLAVPLLHALKWIDGFVHNYGWSIILLTILINAGDYLASGVGSRALT